MGAGKNYRQNTNFAGKSARMKKRQEYLTIRSKSVYNGNIVIWELQSEQSFNFIRPGQFISIWVENETKVFFRRPFSIHYVDYENKVIAVMMKIVGTGTQRLSLLEAGDKMHVIYPLGNGFDFEHTENALLVGGGYGIAPLYHLAQEIVKRGKKATFLLGASREKDFIPLDKFESLSPLFVTTENGESGEKGMVTGHSLWGNGSFDYDSIFSCGPEPMMHAVAEMADQKNIPCFVSLDQMMGCGTGVCLGCVKKTIRGHIATCLHGPVFNAKEIVW